MCFHQADSKLREEEKRALRYLETRRDCNSVQAVSVTQRLSGVFCFADNFTGNEVKKKQLSKNSKSHLFSDQTNQT